MSHRPQIISFTPAAVAVGDTVLLTGFDLDATTAVAVNGTPVDAFTIGTDRRLRIVVAAGTTTGRIAVTTPQGTVQSQASLTILADAPTVTIFAPATGKAGDTVVVTGTHFTGATRVTIGGIAAEFVVESDTVLAVTVPPGAVTGTIAVTGPAGTGTSSGSFTYVPTPVVDWVAPMKAPAGATIAIRGSGLTGATAVAIGGTPAASFTVHSDVFISAVLGSGTTGVVTVTNTHGTGTSAQTVTIVAAPTIIAFTPTAGVPGTLVTIAGTNLGTATAVTFDGKPGRITDVTATTVKAILPPGATMGHIALTTRAGTVTSSGDFTPGVAPEIDFISPLYAEVGDTLTVGGAGLTGATEVTVGGVACTSVVVGSDSSLTAVIAAATPTGRVRVTTPDGVVSSEQQIVIQAAPTISGLTPTSGAVGAAVLITGTHFDGISDVSFNATPAAFAVLSPTAIRATVPAGATTGTVTVTNAAGTVTSASFTVL